MWLDQLAFIPEYLEEFYSPAVFAGLSLQEVFTRVQRNRVYDLYSNIKVWRFFQTIKQHREQILDRPETLSDLWKNYQRQHGFTPDDEPDFAFIPIYAPYFLSIYPFESYIVGSLLANYLTEKVRGKLAKIGSWNEEFKNWFVNFWSELFAPGPFATCQWLEKCLDQPLSTILKQQLDRDVAALWQLAAQTE